MPAQLPLVSNEQAVTVKRMHVLSCHAAGLMGKGLKDNMRGRQVSTSWHAQKVTVRAANGKEC